MRIICLAAFALLACGPGRTTFARYPGGAIAFDRAGSEPKAVEIADKVIAAAGGAQKWQAAKQVRWQQAVTHDGKEIISGEQAWDRWNGRHYARAKRAEGDLVVMRPLYGSGGNAFIDDGQKMRKIEGGTDEALQQARERWEFDTAIMFLPFLLEEPGSKLSYEGTANGDDNKPRDVIKLVFDPKDKTRKATYYLAVNPDTHQIDRIEIQKAGSADTERLGYTVSDYREGGGIKFPGTLQNLGLKGEVITFKELTIADKPDEDLFVPPL